MLITGERTFSPELRHELLTQVNAIIGYSEMVLEEIIDRGMSAWRADLDKIRASGADLLLFLESSRSNPDSLDFTSDLLYFIRTLVTTIVGYADLLIEEADQDTSAQTLRDLEIIRNAGYALVSRLQELVEAGTPLENLGGAMSAVFPLMRDAVSAMQVRKLPVSAARLLIVDDDVINLDLLSLELSRRGYQVETATGGKQALQMIQDEKYDLMILDLVMPEMSGLDVLERLHEAQSLLDLPVVVISAWTEISDIARCIELGAEDFLPRKFNSALLQARIRSILEKKWLREQRQAMLEEKQKTEQLALLASEKKFRQLVSGALVGIFRATLEGVVLEANPVMLALLGFDSVDELNKMGPSRIFVEPMHWLRLQQLLQQSAVASFETRLMRKNGETFPVSMNVKIVASEEDGQVFLEGTLEDITARKQVEEELRIAATAFETDEGILITDCDARIVRVNRAFTRLTGYLAEEAIGKTPTLLHSGRQSVDFYRRMWEALLRDKYWQGDIWNRRKNGEVYLEWLTITAVCDADGQVTHYVAVFSDITQRKLAEEKISFLAYHDRLTELPNRTLFYDRLSQTMSLARRKADRFALLFLDLDGFKEINDLYGHEAGDVVLKATASRLLSCVRDVDTVARMGGDEFAIVLSEIALAHDVAAIAEKIIHLLSEPVVLSNGRSCSVGVSIGIAIHPEDGAEIDRLMSAADSAMYQSKSAGKGMYTFAGGMAESRPWFVLEPAYLLGEASIDHQRIETVCMLNGLNEMVQNSVSEPEIHRAFDEFVTHVQAYLGEEERLMEGCGYQNDAHIREHRHLLAEFEGLKDKMQSGGEYMVLQSLKGWFIDHAMNLDRAFAEFYQKSLIA